MREHTRSMAEPEAGALVEIPPETVALGKQLAAMKLLVLHLAWLVRNYAYHDAPGYDYAELVRLVGILDPDLARRMP